MNRSCGVLLPISALPSKYGIGTLGRSAYQFIDFLKNAGQEYWQILPSVPPGVGDSPYSSYSTFAGNPYFIDLECLVESGLLQKEECENIHWYQSDDTVDYNILSNERIPLLHKAFERGRYQTDVNYGQFKEKNSDWLDDYSLFMALKYHFGCKSWQEWDQPVKLRNAETLHSYKKELSDEIDFWCYIQYLFFSQYEKLKAYAQENDIKIIGDIPICVAQDSVDVWANPQLFYLDAELNPIWVAGVPPDYFSKTGQLWGNPVYDWDGHKKELYDWWCKRLSASFDLFDILRIDHFRAFDEYYAIPYGEETAINGFWRKGPGNDFFDFIKKKLNNPSIIAEDLGGITQTVRELLKDTGYPGMKVLQFGFNAAEDSYDLPHNYIPNVVAYTGTHDNDTLSGWFSTANKSDRKFALDYLGIKSADEFPLAAIRALFCSTANTAIVPIQDWLGLSSDARMNIPSTVGINWKWRLQADSLTENLANKMNHMAMVSRRNSRWKNMNGIYAVSIFKTFENKLQEDYHTNLNEANTVTVYRCVSQVIMNAINENWQTVTHKMENGKQACYMSAEYLTGRLIHNNLYCLGVLDKLKELFEQKGFDFNRFEEIEDTALGNGGLGRLAACFLDSAATHRLPLKGYGIRYRYGIFHQSFKNGFQDESTDDWTSQGDPWSVRCKNDEIVVRFADQTVRAVPYDMPVIGYGSGHVGTLRLWQSEAINDFDFKKFNDQKYNDAVQERNDAERISMVLYPNDDTDCGKALRIKQEYFLASASMQDILRNFKKLHGDAFELIPDFYAVQLNDTHPVMAIPELVRLLIKEGLSFAKAFAISRKAFAYTNHTVMSEALEKWNFKLFKSVVPEIAEIIMQIHQLLLKQLQDSHITEEAVEKRAIISNGTVHIARLAVYTCFAVNGVAEIHTEILKKELFKEWYESNPAKFQNKTNGVTQRRWLGLCNPELSRLISELIGEKWITDLSLLKKLEQYEDDKRVIEEFNKIKFFKKRQLAEYISKHEGIRIDAGYIFDIQTKRLHEYKRQLLNAFSIVNIYLKLREGKLADFNPTVFIFGAKAAPGYARAKGIIKFINEIARTVNNDKSVSDKLKVVFVQNYDVSYAEKLIPAADISEQISTAGTEASGTGNMKFMLNGATTLGTYDGANIEIFKHAGLENNYVFGARVEELEKIKDHYAPEKLYNSNPDLKRAVDTLIDGTFDDGGTGIFKELYQSLLKGASWHRPDNYFLFRDFNDYMAQKLAANAEYSNRIKYARKCWHNIANAGPFSSDRTIAEYARDIWEISPISLP